MFISAQRIVLSIFTALLLSCSLLPMSAQASNSSKRIYVEIGDVAFQYGRPYYRHDRRPLYVVHDHYRPRYYYYDYRPSYHSGFVPSPYYSRDRHHGYRHGYHRGRDRSRCDYRGRCRQTNYYYDDRYDRRRDWRYSW